MEKNISKEDIENILSKVMHPEINFSLLKLGMIKDIEVKDNAVSVTLMLPFLGVPIKEDLINLIKESITNLSKDLKIEIKIAEMNQEGRQKFMELSREGWAL